MFGATAYIKFDPGQLHIAATNRTVQFVSLPHIAIEQHSDGKKTIAAIGQEAKAMNGKDGIQVFNPFDHPRLIADDFILCEKLLIHGIRTMYGAFSFSTPRKIIIHPKKQVEGGLTGIENRFLLELASTIGGRKIAVHEGSDLTMQQVQEYRFDTQHQLSARPFLCD